MNPARSQFQKGDRVELSEAGKQIFIRPRVVPLEAIRGTVVGFCRNGPAIRVRWDHRKTATAYAARFWVRIPEEGAR